MAFAMEPAELEQTQDPTQVEEMEEKQSLGPHSAAQGLGSGLRVENEGMTGTSVSGMPHACSHYVHIVDLFLFA